jgi:hypothetical protein
MLGKVLAAAPLAVLMGTAPLLAQEQPPTTTPTPEAAPPLAAKAATTKKPAPPAHVRRAQHHWYESRDWPWNWPWPRWGYELRHPGGTESKRSHSQPAVRRIEADEPARSRAPEHAVADLGND